MFRWGVHSPLWYTRVCVCMAYITPNTHTHTQTPCQLAGKQLMMAQLPQPPPELCPRRSLQLDIARNWLNLVNVIYIYNVYIYIGFFIFPCFCYGWHLFLPCCCCCCCWRAIVVAVVRQRRLQRRHRRRLLSHCLCSHVWFFIINKLVGMCRPAHANKTTAVISNGKQQQQQQQQLLPCLTIMFVALTSSTCHTKRFFAIKL